MRAACCQCNAAMGEKCPYKEHREQRLIAMPSAGDGRPRPMWCEHCKRAFMEGCDRNGRPATSHGYCAPCLRNAQSELRLEEAAAWSAT